jgi:high-affinity nickel permease
LSAAQTHRGSVGLFFAFGHSLSIAVAVAVIAAAAFALQSGFQDFSVASKFKAGPCPHQCLPMGQPRTE